MVRKGSSVRVRCWALTARSNGHGGTSGKRSLGRGSLDIAERGRGACPKPRAPPLDRDDLQSQRKRSAVELLGELSHRRHTPHEPLVVERPLDEGGLMAAPDAGSRIVFGELE